MLQSVALIAKVVKFVVPMSLLIMNHDIMKLMKYLVFINIIYIKKKKEVIIKRSTRLYVI